MDLTYLRNNWDVVWDRTIEHLQLSLIALAISLADRPAARGVGCPISAACNSRS